MRQRTSQRQAHHLPCSCYPFHGMPLHSLYVGSSPQPVSASRHIRVMCRSKQPLSAARSWLGVPLCMCMSGAGHAEAGGLWEKTVSAL